MKDDIKKVEKQLEVEFETNLVMPGMFSATAERDFHFVAAEFYHAMEMELLADPEDGSLSCLRPILTQGKALKSVVFKTLKRGVRRGEVFLYFKRDGLRHDFSAKLLDEEHPSGKMLNFRHTVEVLTYER